jgi:TrmH family RNA methyltransferase
MGYPAPSKRETALLRALGTRQGRRKSSCCRCEGVRAVRELLEFFPENILFCVGTEKGLGQISFDPQKLRELPEHLFNDISGTVSPQGIIAVAEVPVAPEDVAGDFIFALDGIGDPGNFGTIARSCRAAGVRELWYSAGTVDPWSDKAVRSGMGAQFGLSLRGFASLDELLSTAAEKGYGTFFYADPHGGESCFTAPGLYDRSVVIIGGEPSGSHVERAQSINIPMPGNYESINAAQAATVLIFEYVRRLGQKQ